MKWVVTILGSALAAGMIATPVIAQEEKREQEDCVCPRVEVLRRGDFPEVVWVDGRARLGVWVHTQANAETDGVGALIDRVTPGGRSSHARWPC